MTRALVGLRWALGAALVLAVLPVVGGAVAPSARAATGCPSAPYGVSRSAPGTGKTVALTFDDGPGRDTSRMLGILAAAHATATFFNLGVREAADPASVRAEQSGGYALGGNTWDHQSLPNLGTAGQASEIDRERVEAASITGAYPCLFRPPYGSYDATTLTLAQQRGMRVWNWSVDTEDWKAAGSGDAYWIQRITSRAEAGASQEHPVILMHNQPGGNPATVAALPTIINFYRAHGYQIVDLYGRTGLAAPSVRALSAMSGPTAGGARLAVTGTGFTNVTGVRFGTTPGTWLHVVSSTQLYISSPPHSAGVLDVQVLTTHGASAWHLADHYTYVAPPVIGSVKPTSGPSAGGTRVAVFGRSFVHVTAVHFGARTGSAVNVMSSTSLAVTAPVSLSGIVDIQVITRYGHSNARSVDHYTYVSRPAIAAISPASGPTAGGTRVTVSGSNFLHVTGVSFGSTPGTSVSVISTTQLAVTAPPGVAGGVAVRVTTAYGTSAVASTGQFTYV